MMDGIDILDNFPIIDLDNLSLKFLYISSLL